MRKWILLGLVSLSSACVGAHLPPHVWMPIDHVDSASLFWWTDQRVCQMRVIYRVGDEFRGLTVPVDVGVCLGRLKADGYDIRRTP